LEFSVRYVVTFTRSLSLSSLFTLPIHSHTHQSSHPLLPKGITLPSPTTTLPNSERKIKNLECNQISPFTHRWRFRDSRDHLLITIGGKRGGYILVSKLFFFMTTSLTSHTSLIHSSILPSKPREVYMFPGITSFQCRGNQSIKSDSKSLEIRIKHKVVRVQGLKMDWYRIPNKENDI
jgi:hypothetical protein